MELYLEGNNYPGRIDLERNNFRRTTGCQSLLNIFTGNFLTVGERYSGTYCFQIVHIIR